MGKTDSMKRTPDVLKGFNHFLFTRHASKTHTADVKPKLENAPESQNGTLTDCGVNYWR